MTSAKGSLKPNTRITLGIFWFVLAIIYMADKLVNSLDIRLWDWIAWIAMFTAGLISFIEGFKMRNLTNND